LKLRITEKKPLSALPNVTATSAINSCHFLIVSIADFGVTGGIGFWLLILIASHVAESDQAVHWHAFRYTDGSWLVAIGVDITVVHQLMLHASPRTTLEFYVKARKKQKRTAQRGIEKLLFPGFEDSAVTPEGPEVSDHHGKDKRDMPLPALHH
jgi:hypothetical protein